VAPANRVAQILIRIASQTKMRRAPTCIAEKSPNARRQNLQTRVEIFATRRRQKSRAYRKNFESRTENF
jgi:hypothetical protein